MSRKPCLFVDIGGVLLSNAWDSENRASAVARFGLDKVDFQKRHEMVKTAFEAGRLSLDDYLRRTVFHTTRSFTVEEFRGFMFAQTTPLEESLAWFRQLAERDACRLFSLNNESRELHEFRVRTFKLDEIFEAFFTSCYLGRVKPEEEIYRAALGMAGCAPGEATFIDDRALNVEAAQVIGLEAVQFTSVPVLVEFLRQRGVTC